MATTLTEVVVSEEVVEHVTLSVRKHFKRRQKRGVPVTSQTLVDRIMSEFDDISDDFWHKVAAWYTLAMERTEPKCRGFVASDFFEIVATHLRNDTRYATSLFPAPPADIEARVRADAYAACTAGLIGYTFDSLEEPVSAMSADLPHHEEW